MRATLCYTPVRTTLKSLFQSSIFRRAVHHVLPSLGRRYFISAKRMRIDTGGDIYARVALERSTSSTFVFPFAL